MVMLTFIGPNADAVGEKTAAFMRDFVVWFTGLSGSGKSFYPILSGCGSGAPADSNPNTRLRSRSSVATQNSAAETRARLSPPSSARRRRKRARARCSCWASEPPAEVSNQRPLIAKRAVTGEGNRLRGRGTADGPAGL